ncbi:hypothetical protein Lser_V15G22974 [Lactuca serriola]
MPPRKRPSSKNNENPSSPPPPPQFDLASLQTMMTAAMVAAMSQMNSNNSGGGSQSQNPEGSLGQQRGNSYKDFMNVKPTSFNGTGGVISLSRWFEKIESIFEICACAESDKVKFAACTFEDKALTWWNGRVKSLTLPVANAMGWEAMKELLIAEYCPRGEMQKLEHELWNLKMKGSNVTAYISRFDDLALLCPGLVTPENKKIERFIWGLSQPTKTHVLAARPNTYDSAKTLAQILIDHSDDVKEITTTSEPTQRSGEKRKFWKKKKGQSSQGSSKKHQTVAVHAATVTPVTTVSVMGSTASTPTSKYAGNFPLCDKCKYHHHPGPCRELSCTSCGKKGHTVRFCRTPTQSANQSSGAGVSQASHPSAP